MNCRGSLRVFDKRKLGLYEFGESVPVLVRAVGDEGRSECVNVPIEFGMIDADVNDFAGRGRQSEIQMKLEPYVCNRVFGGRNVLCQRPARVCDPQSLNAICHCSAFASFGAYTLMNAYLLVRPA